MNKEFVKKMLRAKKIECEAIKELMPDEVKDVIDEIQKQAFNSIKDISSEIIIEDMEKKEPKNKAKVKKVGVDFQ